jgi:hypothetical protein
MAVIPAKAHLLSGKEFADLQKHEMRVRMSATVSDHHSH